MATRALRGRDWLPLAGVLVLAAALRLPTLGSQSLWLDEGISHYIVTSSLGGLFEALQTGLDANPPLFHLLLWAWVKVIGSGDAALRSISALAGIATVPIAYLGARELASRRAGLIASSLVATSPLMIFFSQEARPYALAVFLTGLSFLFFARTLSLGRVSDLVAWALSSYLAMATIYFSGIVIAPEAVALLWLARERRGQIALAISGVTVGACALALLAFAQVDAIRGREGADWPTATPLRPRVQTVTEWFAVGVNRPGPLLLAACVGLITIALALVVTRGDPKEKRAALVTWTVFVGALATAAVISLDSLIARYLLPSWIVLAILAAIGFGTVRAGRWGLACAGALCAIWLGMGVAIQFDTDLKRPDWRGLAREIGPAPAARLISLSDGGAGIPLLLYLERTRSLKVGEPTEVREIVYVSERDPHLRPCALWANELRACDRPVRPIVIPPGFHLVRQGDAGQFRLTWLASRSPGRVHATGSGVFLQVAG